MVTDGDYTQINLVLTVLILIVMEDGHWRADSDLDITVAAGVLILIVMEDGHWRSEGRSLQRVSMGLNPYCNGRWSLTLEESYQRAASCQS